MQHRARIHNGTFKYPHADRSGENFTSNYNKEMSQEAQRVGDKSYGIRRTQGVHYGICADEGEGESCVRKILSNGTVRASSIGEFLFLKALYLS